MKIKHCDNSSSYTDKFIKTIFIDMCDSDLKKIISSSMNISITSYSFSEKNNCLKMILNISINIVYSNNKNECLLSKNLNRVIVKYLYLPNTIKGNIIDKNFIQNKTTMKASGVSIYSNKIYNTSNIAINISCIIELFFSSSEYIACILSDRFTNKLVSSFSDKYNFTENLNAYKSSLKCLVWNSYKNSIFFIKNINNYSFICCYNFSKREKIVVTDKPIYKNIKCFTFMNYSNIIFYNENYGDNSIYIFNIDTQTTKKVLLDIPTLSCYKLFYDTNHKLLYFIYFKHNMSILCSYDMDNEIDSIFSSDNISDFTINYDINKCIVKIELESNSKLILIDLLDKSYSQVLLPIEYISIVSFEFYKNENSDIYILVLLKVDYGYKIIKYNMITSSFNIIYSHKNIISFKVDLNTEDIIVNIKENNSFQLLNISNYSQASIVATSFWIKDFCIKSRI